MCIDIDYKIIMNEIMSMNIAWCCPSWCWKDFHLIYKETDDSLKQFANRNEIWGVEVIKDGLSNQTSQF
jgi:hypothetical protein